MNLSLSGFLKRLPVCGCALAGLLFSAGICSAQGPAVVRNSLPIQIKSNELHTDNAVRTATFIGRVVARQGDVTIYSDKLVIHYSSNDKDVDKVEAFGSVRIVQENRLSRGNAQLFQRNLVDAGVRFHHAGLGGDDHGIEGIH